MKDSHMVLKKLEVSSDLTLALLRPDVNKGQARIWPGYFLSTTR